MQSYTPRSPEGDLSEDIINLRPIKVVHKNGYTYITNGIDTIHTGLTDSCYKDIEEKSLGELFS